MGASKVLRVRVESERCQGHNRCCALAPELFEADELGNAKVKAGGMVAPALEAKAKLALANCPEHAIRLSQESVAGTSGGGDQ
jgi:ferredoxin